MPKTPNGTPVLEFLPLPLDLLLAAYCDRRPSLAASQISQSERMPMGLHDLLFPLHARRRFARLAAAIGRRSMPLAAAAVGDRMSSMTLAEARGYVRARARLAVVAEVNALSSAGQAISPAVADQLLELALEQVVGRMIAQRMIDEPAQVYPRRAA